MKLPTFQPSPRTGVLAAAALSSLQAGLGSILCAVEVSQLPGDVFIQPHAPAGTAIAASPAGASCAAAASMSPGGQVTAVNTRRNGPSYFPLAPA